VASLRSGEKRSTGWTIKPVITLAFSTVTSSAEAMIYIGVAQMLL
jgi:hypothetical protein